MGKKRLMIFHPSNVSKRIKKTTTASSATPGCKKVGGRYSMIPSQPSALTYQSSPPDIQPESPIRGFLSPIPMNHSSPYPTPRSVPLPSPQASFHSSGAPPMLSPRRKTPVSSFSLHHSSPVNKLPAHASPVASPIPRRTTRSRRQSASSASDGNKTSQSLTYTTHTQEVQNTIQDPPHSPVLDVPTPFKSSREKKATKPVKRKKNSTRICVYHPPKTKRSQPTTAKKPQAAPVKRQTKANRAEQSQSKVNKSPKFVQVKVEGGEMINLQVTHRASAMKSGWTKAGDIRFSVGTTTEQFRWGLMEVIPSGSKPGSLTKDWMLFTLLSGSADICLDNETEDTLEAPGDSLLVPPGHSYHISNPGASVLKLIFSVVMLS